VGKDVEERGTPGVSRRTSAFAVWWSPVRAGNARGRVGRWRVWLARARNFVTVIFLAAAYALRERRAWMRWPRRDPPGRWMGRIAVTKRTSETKGSRSHDHKPS
jgi:hypothetical protein